MVKKRSQKSRKSDSELSDSNESYHSSSEETSKQYGLRKRLRPIIPDDFEDEVLRDTDEEFDINQVESSPPNSPKKRRGPSGCEDKVPEVNCTVTTISPLELEPELPDTQSFDGMIDFEDVIRADILVNRNRIDYDNIIEKTEIKLELVSDKVESSSIKETETVDCDVNFESEVGENTN